ncbi:replication protein RepA [Methylovulum psychrotolerans]|uniref:Plasmid encoded RepA protein n=1 Tax=Methylovulum psychrotolerans TaxID=1704499 RepID=A0A2S5CFW7_9GAMM|nr:replication protein RepA [Methylovulum psychrotolerans]POZ49657.1 hypothetical protein AADEFJLK_04573 [Methylovulum psychrotolerans]
MADKLKNTKAVKKIINAAVDIAMNPASSNDVAFMNKSLVQANLPHSKPKSDVWVRKNGNLSLVVQAGLDENGESYGLPYGTLPRLGLLLLITKAVKAKSRRIELGNTLNDFIRELGLNPNTGGGKRGDAKRVIEQMNRLFNARFSFIEAVTDLKGNTGKRRLNMEVAPKTELWWDIKKTEQGSLFESWIELGEDFFNAITATPVPLDFRAAVALKQSPLALDIYILLCYEAFRASKSGKSRFIPWASLHEQMGGSYSDVKDFKRKFKQALRKVRSVAPTIQINEENGGIRIIPDSLPAIATNKVM